jgi:hypothetical protein
MKVPPLEDHHRSLISIVAGALSENDAWPFFPYVEAMLDHSHGLAFEQVIGDMPGRLVWAQSGYGGQSLPILRADDHAAVGQHNEVGGEYRARLGAHTRQR